MHIDLSIKTRVVLSGGEYSAMVSKEGRFTLYVSLHLESILHGEVRNTRLTDLPFLE